MDNIIYGAGILFYCKSLDNTPYFFLGKDRDQKWSNFGGRSELSDRSDPENTAARETWEESLGVVGEIHDIKRLIRGSRCILSTTPSGHRYYMYIVKIPFTTMYRTNFCNTKKFLSNIQVDKKFLEILDVKLMSLETIQYSIDITNKKTFVKLRSIFEQTFINNFEEICTIVKNK
tara:strand:- start:7772 stop:8296 length:525 start_codon:yes stop_codon:yes gene_type:complete